MPTFYSNLATKIEAASAYLHGQNITNRTAFSGLDSATQTLPCALYHAEVGEERPLNSGNYRCKLTISVMDSADRSTLAQHREGSAEVFDLFLDEDFAQMLSNVPAVNDLTILMVNGRNGSDTRVEDRQWISSLTLDLYACSADIT